MKTLGISFNFHDASAAVVVGGSLAFAASEERFSLQKHASHFPVYAIEASLNSLGIDIHELDNIVFYEKPHDKFVRILDQSMSRYPFGLTTFNRAMKKWLGSSLWVRNIIANELGVNPAKIEYVNHHHSHIAQAFGDSPFQQAAVLIIDAVGECASTTLASVTDRHDVGSIKEFETFDYPNSIGLIYAALTAYLGFEPNSDESSTMALAAYGSPRYVSEIEQIIRRNPDNSYRVDSRYFDFERSDRKIFTDKLIDLLGDPKNLQRPYLFSTHGEVRIDKKQQRFADIAASLQQVLEDVVLGLCQRLKVHTGLSNLCYAGGVALNCIVNSAIVKSGLFDQVFIPSNPGDGGAATGAAYLGNSFPRDAQAASVYLGPAPETDQVTDFLDLDYLNSLYSESVVKVKQRPSNISIDHCRDDEQLVGETARELSEGRIVGWVQGQLEFGPRALGNRSLLIDPSNTQALQRLSRQVKSHAAFRPYALSIHANAASQILNCGYLNQNLLRWMQSVWPVRANVQEKLVTGLHINGTTRPQVCDPNDNPLFCRLLERFGDRRGLPALLNTSFNERGMPIVSNAMQALVSFLRTGMDTLVLENTIIRKVY